MFSLLFWYVVLIQKSLKILQLHDFTQIDSLLNLGLAGEACILTVKHLCNFLLLPVMQDETSVTPACPFKGRVRQHEATRITTVVRGQIGDEAETHQ